MMKYLTDEQYSNKIEKIKAKNKRKEQIIALKAEKNKYKSKLKLPSTSKLLLLGAILLCIEIVIFCEYVMFVLQDTSAMYVLIGIPASLIPVILGYFYKSKSENVQGGIIYETAMRQMQNEYETTTDENITETDDIVG